MATGRSGPAGAARVWLACGALVLTLGCDGTRTFPKPSAPTPVPSPTVVPPALPLPFPSIEVGEVVRFQITADDRVCVHAAGRCRSYAITPRSDGRLEVVLTAVSSDSQFVSTTELYLVPGADDFTVGPGQRISANALVKAGSSFEIRMYWDKVPTEEFELRTALQ